MRAGQEDVDSIAGTLARAFQTDPVSAYLFPDAGLRGARLKTFFCLQLENVYLPRGEVYTTSERTAAALWLPPGTKSPGLRVQLVYLSFALRTHSFRRGRRLAIALYKMRPREAHYYLGTIGTDPACQRRGLGAALISSVVARLDSTATPAYLEASSEENVRFYTSLGFSLVQKVTVAAGGPTLWTMWREPLRA